MQILYIFLQITMSPLSSFYATFEASIKSVGTAIILAVVGIYLHRRGIVSLEEKRTLAKISQQVVFPLFLFTKTIYCNQNWSDQPCPDITKSLQDVWILLFWPAFVVGIGLLLGYGAAVLSDTPKSQLRPVLVACGFGNSTGLPITLLTVVRDNSRPGNGLGQIDPTLFLSVYLLLYPVLQWGVGGWLLAPEEDELDSTQLLNTENQTGGGGQQSKRSHAREDSVQPVAIPETPTGSIPNIPFEVGEGNHSFVPCETTGLVSNNIKRKNDSELSCNTILSKTFQPPVVGALVGIVVAATPLRGLFVDLLDRDSDAPFEWLFDALYEVGQAAIPLNMMILGCNLSASQLTTSHKLKADSGSVADQSEPIQLLSKKTMISIVIAKMILMPLVGTLSTILLRRYILDIPEGKLVG